MGAMMLKILLVIALLSIVGCGGKAPPDAMPSPGATTMMMGQGQSNGIACDPSLVGAAVCATDAGGDTWIVYCNTDDRLWGFDCSASAQTCVDDGVLVYCQ
jgi:hypothetical protein